MVTEAADSVEAGIADVMLDAFDVAVDGLFVDAQEQEKAGEDLVPEPDVLGDLAAALGQGKTPVAFVAEVTEFSELFHHDADAGAAELEFPGDVRNPGVALGEDEVVDPLEVILLADGGRR